MDLQQVKSNLNKMIVYKGLRNVYRLTACILRKSKQGFYYQAELQDTISNNCVMYVSLTDVEVEK